MQKCILLDLWFHEKFEVTRFPGKLWNAYIRVFTLKKFLLNHVADIFSRSLLPDCSHICLICVNLERKENTALT